MSAAKRLLTKSKFAAAYECPRKLYYLNHPEVYANANSDDSFLKALAESGFQVGALAQQYYQPGHLIDTLDKDQALSQTKSLLAQDNVTLFEAAFQFEHLFVRADIVRKKGDFIELIEVKAKSFDSQAGFKLWNSTALKKNQYKLLADGASYVIDLAFQTWVIQHAMPNLKIRSFLCMVDKSKVATVDGLNQFFRIVKGDKGRSRVEVSHTLKREQLGAEILSTAELTDDIKHVINDVQFENGPSFRELIAHLQQLSTTDQPGKAVHSNGCKGCEFRVNNIEKPQQSGFNQCWEEKIKDTSKPFVFDIWNFRAAGKLVENGVYLAEELTEDDLVIKPREDGEDGLSNSERQLLQIDFVAGRRKEPFHLNRSALKKEMQQLKYPLHFIDFETCMSALPFHKDCGPYEQLAFQFSHHVLHEDGRIEERKPFLETTPGKFPNFEFVRALKDSLESDDGAVLRYAPHENTVLCQIRDQLLESTEPDLEELVEWIQTLATPPERLAGDWKPTRQFVDMWEWVKKYCYLPEMGGSNSIKKVLPAVLRAADFTRLKQRFGEWIQPGPDGKPADPYKQLPPVFTDVDLTELRKVIAADEDSEIADGGAAMVAYRRLQFSEMTPAERQATNAALLRYCGLDTLAMVMIYDWWLNSLCPFWAPRA